RPRLCHRWTYVTPIPLSSREHAVQANFPSDGFRPSKAGAIAFPNLFCASRLASVRAAQLHREKAQNRGSSGEVAVQNPSCGEGGVLQFGRSDVNLRTVTTPAKVSNVTPCAGALTLITEARLDAATNGTTAWYLVAAPTSYGGAEMAFL